MHSELRDGLHIQQVDYYDGQSIFCNSQLCYSLGEYLGGGTAGVYVELSYSSICVRLLDLVQACLQSFLPSNKFMLQSRF
ncbi:hypothetical protein ABG067_004910 [Albugo candida]